MHGDARDYQIDKNDSHRYDGKTVRMKGDCHVMGSNEDTSISPQFSLMTLFLDHQVFPKVVAESFCREACTSAVAGGYLHVIQGDNACPHVNAGCFHDTFVKGFCECSIRRRVLVR